MNGIGWVARAAKASPQIQQEGMGRPLIVIIDPGHGGIDSGATKYGIKESEMALQFAKKLEADLARNPNFTVILTRNSDIKIPLDERVRRAEESRGDVLLSLHFNSNENGNVAGTEIFMQNSLPLDEEELQVAEWDIERSENSPEDTPGFCPAKACSSKLKPDVQDILMDIHKQEKLRASFYLSQYLKETWSSLPWKESKKGDSPILRQAPFRVIRNTSMPALLIEFGYITNLQEAQKLSRPEVQNEMVSKVRSALLKFKEKIDKDAPVTLH